MTDISWTGDRWPSSHAIRPGYMNPATESTEFPRVHIHTVCGLRGAVRVDLIKDALGVGKSCENCARLVLRTETT